MRVSHYKSPVPRLASIRGHWLALSPLPPAALDRAEGIAAEYFRARKLPADGAPFEIERQLQVLALATGAPADELRAALDLIEALTLFGEWLKVQEDHTPDCDKLSRWCRWGVLKEPAIKLEAAIAYQAQTAAEYYGRPLVDLTVGQIAYWSMLRAAYHEFEVEGRDKKVTRKWVESLKPTD